MTVPVDQPTGVCRNCYVVWRAKRPRPQVVYCHHTGNAARETANGWRTLEAVSAAALTEMREKGLL